MIEAKAYTQVSYIISLMSENLKRKIPQDLIDLIEEKKDKNYEIEYTSIKSMKLLNDTKKLLSVIYTDYIATDEERRIIQNKERVLSLKQEKEKHENFSVDLFSEKEKRKEVNKDTYLVRPEKDKWYIILLKRIKKSLGL